ncbi:hypothetical protein [Kiloniella sp.]|uniref:hypothetical protein n=1 Tax=Kiloniella sp. TaxID=1938587 RepID=UPI003B012681
MYVVETVSWNAQADVSNQQMVDAVNNMLPDLKTLPGFKYQSLSKNDAGRWVEIYYWETSEDAHRSNELMADKVSLHNLIALIDIDSLSIEVLLPLQESSPLNID